MIDYACFGQSKHLHAHQGLKASQSAKALTLAPRTVSYWLAQEPFHPRQSWQHPSQLDPFKTPSVRRLEHYPSSAAQGFQRLRAQGFDGGYAIVKASVRTVRPRRQAAFLTLAFALGECAQVDWGSFGSVQVGQTCRRLSFFVMVLCYRRMMDVELTVSQTMEHCLACHQHACAFFGGRPHKVMVDNLTSAVLKRALGEAPVCNPTYLDFATPHGFPLAPCSVGKGHEKGRVENGVGYVQKTFLAGLALPDFRALHPAARQWLDTVANVRLHGATRDKPTALWHPERPSLRPLPLHPFDLATVSQVRASRQFRIPVETNRYAVPAHYAGHALTRKTSPDRLGISLDDTLIARHARRDDRFQDLEDPDHPKPLLEQRQKARDHQLFRRFLALSPRAEAYALTLEERRLTPHHHVRNIVALSDIYTPEAVSRALEDALVYEAFSSDSIANLWEPRARFTPEARALHLTRREDRLEVRLEQPDLSIYQAPLHLEQHDTEEPDAMSASPNMPAPTTSLSDVEPHLTSLQRSFIAAQYAALAKHAAQNAWPHVDSLARLVEGEADVRRDRATKSRLRLARFPVITTLEQCRWDWPTRINRLQVQQHFHLALIKDKATRILRGGVGLGTPHLATTLGYAACLQGHSVLFASAIDVINTLAAARSAGRLNQERKQYTQPALLLLDALGYLPIAKAGADRLFHVISLRDEQGAIILTSHRALKEWPKIFNQDNTLTAALLDRLLHHAETGIIEGKRFRMKDPIESETSLHEASPEAHR